MAEMTRLEIVVQEEDVDLATGLLARMAAFGWEEESLPTGETRFRVYAESPAFCHDLEAAFAARLPQAALTQETVEKKDWVLAWREFFTPVPIGEQFVVIAPWMEEEWRGKDVTPLVIEPKFAFGTGHHPTTAFCLAVLVDLWKAGRLKPGMRFFDLGTGSGILSVAAAKMGMTGIGADIDPLAVENALENRSVNGMESGFEVRPGSVEAARGETFDLVVANILAEPLRQLAPDVVSLLRPGGALVLSGILDTQARSVEDAYRKAGLGTASTRTDGEWAVLTWA